MGLELEIELYADGDREIVFDLLRERLGTDVAKLEKKFAYMEQLSLQKLLTSKTLDYINGTKNPRLYELKISSLSRRQVRFVCSIETGTLILLDVFFASGSGGRVEKYILRAKARLMAWRSQNKKEKI